MRDISNGNSSLPSQADMSWEGATLLPMRKREKKKTERQAKEVISEAGVIGEEKKINNKTKKPWITRAWLGCSWAVPVLPSPSGQWDTVHSPKSRRRPHAWRYPSPFIHLHSLHCTLIDFPEFILCCTFQWLWLSDAFSDKTLVFQLLLPKFHYLGLNFPSKHLLQSKSWGENTWKMSRVS